jgi:carbon monoxide dehydrogenase subunit G
VFGDEVYSYTAKTIKGDITFTIAEPNGRKHTSEQLDHFIGETLESKKTDGSWGHTLTGRQPNEKEQAALARMSAWFEDRDFFPSERQKLGDSWDVDPEHINRVLRTDMSAVSGKLRATLADVRVYNADLCAVIQYRGTVRGRVEFGDEKEQIGTTSINVNVLRSLKTGVDVKIFGQIAIQSVDRQMVNGVNVDVATSARLKLDSLAKVEK